jgi:hypothetical protein
MTKYTPTDILNFIKELLKNDPNVVNVKINPPDTALSLQAGSSTSLNAHSSITIEYKNIKKPDYFRTLHDSLKDFLKNNEHLFSLIPGSGNTLIVLLM